MVALIQSASNKVTTAGRYLFDTHPTGIGLILNILPNSKDVFASKNKDSRLLSLLATSAIPFSSLTWGFLSLAIYKITTTPESSLHEENLDILHYLAKTILVLKNGSFYNADFKLDYKKEFINMELVSLLGLVIIFFWPVIIIYFLIQKFKTTSRIVSFNDWVVGIMSKFLSSTTGLFSVRRSGKKFNCG